MRAIDADKLLDDITAAEKHRGMGAVVAGTLRRYIMRQPTLTPPNEWVRVEDAMPPEHEPVLCIVDGKPKPNITLEDAYQIGSWNKADGWIIDEYLDWEDADVSWWMPLPAPPDKDNNVPAKTPNEPLTQADIDKMHFDRVWIDYGVDDSGERCGEEGVVLYGKLYSIDTLDGAGFEDLLLDACDGETLDRPSGDYKVYRCQPNEPLTCDGCYWQTHGSFGKCIDCIREKTDHYCRPPEGKP